MIVCRVVPGYERIDLSDGKRACQTRHVPDMTELASLIRPVFVVMQQCETGREDQDRSQDDGGARRSRQPASFSHTANDSLYALNEVNFF